jgi:hypothetical protein
MRWLGPRLALLTAAVVLLLIGFGWFVNGSAGADPAGQRGWWTVTNAGPAPEGLPVPTTPPPPDVPSGGSLVQGGPSSPIAYTALVYQLPQGAKVGDLTLKVASSSATTTGSTLEVCPLTNPTIHAEQGGPMADAPQYDCAKKTTAQPASSGASYHFNVSSFVTDGALAVAILPTSPSDRVVFSQPGGDSLMVQPGTIPGPGTPAAQDTTPAGGAATTSRAGSPGAAALGPSSAPAALAPTLGGSAAGPSAPALATPPGQNSASAAPQTPTALQTTTNSSSHGGGPNPAAVGALLAGLLLAGGLWLFAGHTATQAGA